MMLTISHLCAFLWEQVFSATNNRSLIVYSSYKPDHSLIDNHQCFDWINGNCQCHSSEAADTVDPMNWPVCSNKYGLTDRNVTITFVPTNWTFLNIQWYICFCGYGYVTHAECQLGLALLCHGLKHTANGWLLRGYTIICKQRHEAWVTKKNKRIDY